MRTAALHPHPAGPAGLRMAVLTKGSQEYPESSSAPGTRNFLDKELLTALLACRSSHGPAQRGLA